MSSVSWLRFTVLVCLAQAACGWCGEVWTSDGRVTEGVIKLDTRGDFLVLSPSATATKVKADDAVYAWFGSLKGPGGFLPAVPLNPAAVGTPKAPILALTGGVYTLKGGGDGIADSADKCSFFSREINGNAELVARITDVGAADAQVGLSIRESTAPGARQITILVNPSGELRVRYRRETNGPLIEVPMDKARAAAENPPGKPRFPLQLKLIRKGRNFVWYKRKDDRGWWGPSGQIFADWQYDQWAGGGRKGPEPGIGMSGLALGGLVLVSGAEAEARGVADEVRVRDSLTDPVSQNAPEDQTDLYVNTRLENTSKGLWLRDGTFLVGAKVSGMENDQVRFEDAAGAQTTLNSSKLARANLTSVEPGLASNIPLEGTGVLLASGEFMDGRFDAWKDGKITVSSIVFGLSTFKFPEEAKALVWHAPTAAAGRWIVSLRDGSVIVANSLRADQLDVLIDEPLIGQRRVAGKDVYAVRASAGQAVPLSTLRPKIGTRTPDRAVIAGPCFEPAWSSWLTAGNRGAAFGVASPVGTELTYDIPPGTRHFVCWTGMPERISGDLELRFVVLLDSMKVASVALPKGKEGRGIVPLSIPVSGKKTLTLRVEAEGKFPDNRPPDGYGIWGDALWLK